MIVKELKPKRALNKAFLKVKPNRTEIEGFKAHLITLLENTINSNIGIQIKDISAEILKLKKRILQLIQASKKTKSTNSFTNSTA